jgi:hypothetical protein
MVYSPLMKFNKTQNKILMIGSGILLGIALYDLIRGMARIPFFPINMVGVCAVGVYVYRDREKPI